MNYQSEMNSQINSAMSLYIPHVFPNFDKAYIAGVFEFLEFGRVDHVDLVAKTDKNGKHYNAAYIHFAEWSSGPLVENFQARVRNPKKEARIVHDDPWYWIVLENTAEKRDPGARKPTLDLSDYEEEKRPVMLGDEGAEELYDVEYEDEDEEEEAVKFVEIAPGLSKIEFSPKMQAEMDAIIAEHYHQPMDLSCELDETYLEDELRSEIRKLRDENTLLHTTISMHTNHANDCHAKLAELRLEIDRLNKYLNAQALSLQEAEVLLDEARQENIDKEQELDEARQEIFLLEEVLENGLVAEEPEPEQ
jgi:hypothetical protein